MAAPISARRVRRGPVSIMSSSSAFAFLVTQNVVSSVYRRYSGAKNLGEIAHLLGRMLVQAPGQLFVEIGLAERVLLILGQDFARLAALDFAEPEAAAHLAAIIGVAHEMRHAAEIDRMIEIADPRADGDSTGCIIARLVEQFGRIVKADTQLVDRTARSGEIFVHQMRGADIVTVLAVFPIAEQMIGRMPHAVLFGTAEPAEPPMDHPGTAARHTGQRRDKLAAASDVGITGFHRQITGVQKQIGLFDLHTMMSKQLRSRSYLGSYADPVQSRRRRMRWRQSNRARAPKFSDITGMRRRWPGTLV